MARRIAMAMVLVAGCSSTTDAPPAPTSTTTAPPSPQPASTTVAPQAPPSTTTTAGTVEASSGRTSTSVARPTATSTAPPPPASTTPPAAGAVNQGKASWYARGARTANGEAFEPDGFTAAHRTLAFGTRLNVCHDGRCVEVRINDRGPALWTGRVIDLSRGAFAAIAPLGAGVVEVTWTEAA